MPTIRDVEGAEVESAEGKLLGRVDHVLFHPSEPRVVGVSVKRSAVAYVVPRGEVYVQLEGSSLRKGKLRLEGKSVPKRGVSEKRLGYSWDETVIWRGMPAVTPKGTSLGLVKDAAFAWSDGTLERVLLSGGGIADLAVGSAAIEGALAVGFDGEHVVLRRPPKREEASGGMARKAGQTSAAVKVTAERTLKDAGEKSRAALQKAASSKTARDAYAAFKRFRAKAEDALGMNDDEDDE